MFSTLYGTYFSFQMHLKILSAICFNSDQSKILLSGYGLNHIFNLMHADAFNMLMLIFYHLTRGKKGVAFMKI